MQPTTAPTPAERLPLVVDLDGTLVRSDMLVETLVRTVRRSPVELVLLPWRLARGRAAFKQAMARDAAVAVGYLPYDTGLLAWLTAERAAGTPLILATAADRRIADAIADHLGIFDAVLCSDGRTNLKGAAKRDAIRGSVGDRFRYAGDSAADRPVWQAAEGAILVGTSPALAAAVAREATVERSFPRPRASLATWTRALRVHQWTKNLLLFVPLFTSFGLFRPAGLAVMALAFLAFSIAASATYLVNDMWDLDSDRAHPRKSRRPFASGAIPLTHGIRAAAGGLLLALVLALAVSPGFAAMLLVYLALTSSYSLMFKEYVLIDVILLAMLYTFRILAGAVAVAVPLTPWLLAFSMFLFLSLALVKRCAELVSLGALGRDATHGRDYRVSDLVVLWPFGVASAVASAVVFGMFVSQADTRARYAAPDLLWIVAIGLVYWLARLWIKTSRDEMHDDPILYALRDRGSRIAIGAMVAVTLAAQWLPLERMP
ncbi:UbiA family prenyltransferase [Sphingomonas sp. VNH70]|uniref:UbiA family prenyltransferase n=1 Tax=Sphingomonas silueang TaxID=3156617 RepID=UPI0032B38268